MRCKILPCLPACNVATAHNRFLHKVLDSTNPQLVADLQSGAITPEVAAISYDYTAPLVMLACLGIAALLLGFVLKIIDKKNGYGLEKPNITE